MNCKICDKSFTGLVCFQQHEASEKHKKKVKLHQDTAANGAYQETTTNDNDLLIIPCTVCEIQLTGLLNFQAHLNSLQHADMVKKKSTGNIALKNQPVCTPKEPVIAEAINHIYPGSVAPGSVLQCEICQKHFSGPAPYQQHIVSEAHKKKFIQKGLNIVPGDLSKSASNEPVIAEAKTEINPGPNISFNLPNVALGSYAQCEICQMEFSGPAPYQQHIVSKAHKKKSIQKELISNKLSFDTVDSDKIMPFIRYQEKVSNNGTSGTTRPFAECAACNMKFSGPEPYQLHLDSAGHQKKFGLEHNSSMQQEKVSNNGSSGTASPFAECAACNMQFSGPEPYQLHLDSAGHQKKIALEHNSSIQVSGNTNGFSSSWKCGICDNYFSGPIPYNDHLESKGHKKKVQNVELLKTILSTLPAQPDSTTPFPDYIAQDVKINAEPLGINSEWYCEVCKIQTTGPDPYRQHLFGELHRKNIRAAEGVCYMEKMRESLSNANQSQNELSKDEEFSSNLTNFNNGDKTNEFSKGFRISNDLILCDALKNIGVVRPEDLNITVFYPNDEIVFDNTIKKNNYNDKIIAELNCEK